MKEISGTGTRRKHSVLESSRALNAELCHRLLQLQFSTQTGEPVEKTFGIS